MTELAKRLLTALFVVPILVYVIIVGGIPFLFTIILFIILGEWEFYNIMEVRGFKPMKNTGIVSGILLSWIAFFSNEYYLNIILTITVMVILMMQLSKRDVKEATTGIAVTIFGVIYIGWLLSHIILLRNIEEELIEKYGFTLTYMESHYVAEDIGRVFVFMVLAASFMNDAGAYFVGKAWGKRKIAPVVSPNKTVEGTVGGLITSSISIVVVKWIFGAKFAYIHCIILGILIGAVGLIGDLVESLLKRDAEIKDSGYFFPGHGGVLDRLDSLLFTFPISYYYIKIILLKIIV